MDFVYLNCINQIPPSSGAPWVFQETSSSNSTEAPGWTSEEDSNQKYNNLAEFSHSTSFYLGVSF